MQSVFLTKLKQDKPFRIKLFLCLSVIFNAVYAIFLFVVGKNTTSKWFFVMSLYNAVLCCVRLYVFSRINKGYSGSMGIKTMRLCGCCLLLINLVVATMMFILINGDREIEYHQITVITLATYSFATLTFAIVNTIKYLRTNEHVLSCVKLISLISASVSLVTLTNTMLATFGEENLLLRSIILPILCAVVSIFIIFF